jgi:hypothetical protein
MARLLKALYFLNLIEKHRLIFNFYTNEGEHMTLV